MRPSLLTYQPMDCMVAVRFRGPRFEKRRGSVVARLGTQGPIQILELRDHLIGVEARDSRFPSSQRHLRDRKSTRLNSSHVKISYAVFCLKKKKLLKTKNKTLA